ncbi:MAG: hypothetical protein JNK48_33190, partial [Bryobacterales bacterium]|nr:hypothetical protein [Bryobacterales bacterium]
MKPKWLAALAATGVLFAQSTEVEDPGVQQMAANAYAAKYGVSVSVATARLQLQDRASGIEDRLESMLGQQYAGVWFDAAKQGRLQVGIAPGAVGSEAAIRGLLAAYNLSADTDLVSVTYTAEQLLQRQRSISASIGDIVAAGKARIHSDPKRNRVGVVAIQSLSANDESRIAQIGQMPDVYLRRTNHPNEKITFNACTIGRCNPPLLGGRASD